MKFVIWLISFAGLVLLAVAPCRADVAVKGYYRKDGTYVAPYVRSSPNSTKSDNYGTKGNVNPYTGKEGTKPGDAVATSTPATQPAANTTAVPSSLRTGVVASSLEYAAALALNEQGWVYVMPRPKSPQAAWGHKDGRTTWYVGYWTNTKAGTTSSGQPVKGTDGKYAGDGKGFPSWRNGGSPRYPTKIEWLCSKSGGPSASMIP